MLKFKVVAQPVRRLASTSSTSKSLNYDRHFEFHGPQVKMNEYWKGGPFSEGNYKISSRFLFPRLNAPLVESTAFITRTLFTSGELFLKEQVKCDEFDRNHPPPV